jgi:inorganic pyrophosphatase
MRKLTATPTCRRSCSSKLSNYFELYKDPELRKWVKIRGWHDAAVARRMIVRAIGRFRGPG